MNLLSETLNILLENGKTPEDVLWVGDETRYMSWEDFKKAAYTSYDNGYGSEEVFESLKIVGKDFWLERNSYDGSEWWEYKTYPIKPETEYQSKLLTKSQVNRKLKEMDLHKYVYSDYTLEIVDSNLLNNN